MPTKKKMPVLETAKPAKLTKTSKPMPKMTPVVIKSSGVCRTCSVLPVGSVELTSLLLVLVFSLVSVLFTAVLALDSQHQKISALEHQVQGVQIK